MLVFIKDWVLNIVTLVLFIVLIEILVPTGRMKKYTSLVTGFILIIAVINPFLKLMGGEFSLEDAQRANSSYIDRLEIEKNSKLLKEAQMKQIVEVYRKKIIKQLEDSAKETKEVIDVKADVIINEDYNSDKFGEIKRAYLEVSLDAKKAGIKPVARVDKVRAGGDIKPVPAENQLDPVIRKQLEDRIESIYKVDKGNIVITQLKE